MKLTQLATLKTITAAAIAGTAILLPGGRARVHGRRQRRSRCRRGQSVGVGGLRADDLDERPGIAVRRQRET